MQQLKINISADILNWIISQVSQYSISDSTRRYLSDWKAGDKVPTFNQIEMVSKSTGIPLGYFFLKTPPVENIALVNYRTINSELLSNPSRNLIDTIHDMDNVQTWVREYQIANGNMPCGFVGAYRNENKPIALAAAIRKLLNLKIDWYNQSKKVEDSFNIIRTAISNIGTVVMMNGVVGNNTHRALDIEEFRAFAVVDEYAPLIFINANDSINGRLFSLLHEFVHICIGEDSLYNDYVYTINAVQPVETLCNAVAAEILVPQQIFMSIWNNMVDDNEPIDIVGQLANKFRCGTIVIARKAYDNRLIELSVYQQIYRDAIDAYNRFRKRRKESSGGDFYKTIGSRIDRRFLEMVVGSVRTGNTQYTEAFRLTNTSRATFNTLVNSVLGGGVV